MLQYITTVIMGKRASSRRFKAFVTVFSQNCLGLKTGERFTEMIDVLTQRKAFAVGVQETWRSGVERFDQQGWRYLYCLIGRFGSLASSAIHGNRGGGVS